MFKDFNLLVEGTDIKIISKSECVFCGNEYVFTDLEKKILDKEGFKYPDYCPLCNFKILNGYGNLGRINVLCMT